MNSLAMIVGVVLGLLALGFVLQPLFSGAPAATPLAARPKKVPTREDPAEAMEELAQDRAAGKLSDADYASLAKRYEAKPARAASAGDAAEAAVAVLRGKSAVCPQCGPRPEADPGYCSKCGRFLAGQCPSCERAVVERGARYCAGCGDELAA
jgi:hypothetical protein